MYLKTPIEREFKFIVKDQRIFSSIAEKKGISGFLIESPREIIMHDTYFDSDDLDLYNQKAGLRLRKIEQKFWITFKKHIKQKKGILERDEIEEELTSIHFENAIKEMKLTHPFEMALALSYQKSIKPIVDLSNQRQIFRLTRDKTIIDLCLDMVSYKSSNPLQLDFEIEIEHLSGDQEPIQALISSLTSEYRMVKSKSSKYKRCLEANLKIKKKIEG